MNARSLIITLGLLAGTSASAGPFTATTAHESVTAATPAERLVERLEVGHTRLKGALSERDVLKTKYLQAVKKRDEKAGQIVALKEGGVDVSSIRQAMKDGLYWDEQASTIRARLSAAEGRVSQTGASLLQVYEAALLQRRKEAMRGRKGSAKRQRAVRVFQILAEQRDGIRRALLPTQSARSNGTEISEVSARADDDIETLLDKADLARDLEERFLRRAGKVRARILEMEAERSVARDVVGMVKSNSLFDETDRRLSIVGSDVTRSQGPRGPGLGSGRVLAGAPSAPVADNGERAAGDGDGDGDDDGGDDAFAGAIEDTAPEGNDPSKEDGVDSDIDMQPPPDDIDGDGISDGGGGRGDVDLSGQAPNVGAGFLQSVGAEQVLDGAIGAGGSQARLEELLSRDNLSLKELKELEKRLRSRAKNMRSESKRIRSRLKSEIAGQQR